MHKPTTGTSQNLTAAVSAFADTVLERCAAPAGLPLLANFLEPQTRQPRRFHDAASGAELLVSNLGNQLNFLRVLDGLTVLTGKGEYRERALAICRFMLRHGRRRGMLLWGNHAALDLFTGKPVFLSVKGKIHELKAHYPPYELFHAADPGAWEEAVQYHWHGHMYDWALLDFSRHGRMDLPDYKLPAAPWSAAYAGGPPFFIGGGLSFLNAGSDLYYAAAALHALAGRPEAMVWAERLLGRFVQTRDPRTGMGGYQISQVFDKTDPERKRSGDRARLQFQEQFPEHRPLDGTMATQHVIRMVAAQSALCRLRFADCPGAAGEYFTRTAVEDAEAYVKWAYEFADNQFHPCFTDGFRLTGQVITKDGYYGKAGKVFSSGPGGWLHFWAFLACWRRSGSGLLWDAARNIGRHSGLGDIGAKPGDRPALTLPPGPPPPNLVFALLEMEKALPGAGWLQMAGALAETMVAGRHADGFFAGSEADLAGMDAVEPLAVLQVAAQMAGKRDEMLPYCTNSALNEDDGWVLENEGKCIWQ